MASVNSSTGLEIVVASTDCPETPPEDYIYMNSLAWIAGFVKRKAKETEFSEEQMQAQVEQDLQKLLDDNWRPH